MMYISFHDFSYYDSFYSYLIGYLCQCQMLNIAIVCKYIAHMGH